MTPKQSTARLLLYVATSVITSASAGLATLDLANHKQLIGYALGILATGLVTARSYIDQSPNQVVTDAVTATAKEVIRSRASARGDRPENL